MSLKAEEHDGLYGASIIQMVINRVFFKNTTDDGVRLGDLYSPFPLPGLALILTAVCPHPVASRMCSSH